MSQGGRLHRAGDIAISLHADGTIWVGGRAVTMQRGTVVA
jgi:predicted PhzF superfamily epimerase YddE/YHI9